MGDRSDRRRGGADPGRREVIALAAGLLAAPSLAAAAVRPRHRLAAPHIVRRAASPLPVVTIDPGHGGRDPGAIGTRGTYEKHIAIAAATALHDRLARGGRVRPVLTRDTDRFIPLADRVAIAQAHGASLFMSVHADAIAASHAVRGASVYTLSDTASDSMAAGLAQRENSADRFAGRRTEAATEAVADILASLVRQETRAGSAALARGVVGSLAPATLLLTNPSRHAAFAVLRAPDIPSVLVEMGFMSNPADEALLRTADHRARVAAALAGAVEGFFARPRGFTRLQG